MDSDMSDDNLFGREVMLDGDRSVAIFPAPQGDGSWVFEFRNGDVITPIRLSEEAITAAISLYAARNDDGTEARYVYSILDRRGAAPEVICCSEIAKDTSQ